MITRGVSCAGAEDRLSSRSRCGITVYLGSRAEARPAWKMPHRAVAEAASRAAPDSALTSLLRGPASGAAREPAVPATASTWPALM
jgi:hypothetical protein